MPKNNTSFNVKVETGQEVYGEILTLLRGYSPYELALKDGFVGTEEEWIASLVGEKGEVGDGIEDVVLNDDYTLTIFYTNGDQYTTPHSIRGETGATGNGIKSATLNPDYTLTLLFTDGGSYTTIPIRGLQGERGLQGIQGIQGETGNGISRVKLNSDYTLTIYFTDGTSNTTSPIRGAQGEKGETGNGIKYATMNPDYTLTIKFTDGSEYTTPVLRGVQGIQGMKGDVGNGIDSAVLNSDYTLTLNFTDGTSYTTTSIRGQAGERGEQGVQGEPGNGIAKATLNPDYTLTLSFTDGSSYTTSSIRGEKGEKGEKGDSGDSPTITTTKSGKRTTIYADDSPIGTVDDGADGHTPVITATKSGKVTTIKADGTTIAEINDGNDGATGATGASGSDGKDGKDGADGFSPTATVSKSGSTATITITDKNGTTTAEIHDGQGGTGTIDPTPTEGSTNAVSSGGVYDELTDLKSDLNDLEGYAQTGNYSFEGQIVQGTYADDSGAVAVRSNRLRVKDPIRMTPGSILKFKAGNEITNIFLGLSTDGGASYVDEVWQYGGYVKKFTQETYVILVFKNDSNSDIVPTDFDATIKIVTAIESLQKSSQTVNNLLDISSINLFDKNDPDVIVGASIKNEAGQIQKDANGIVTGFIPIEPGKQYNIHIYLPPDNDIYVPIYDANLQQYDYFIKTSQNIRTDSLGHYYHHFSFSSGTRAKYIRYTIPSDGFDYCMAIETSDFNYMLYKEYKPQINNPSIYPITLEGGGFNNDGSVTYSISDHNNYRRTAFYIDLKEAEKFWFLFDSWMPNSAKVRYYDINFAQISEDSRTSNVTDVFIVPETAKYFRVSFATAQKIDVIKIKMIGNSEAIKEIKRTQIQSPSERLTFPVFDDVLSTARLILPSSYSQTGDPVPLVLWMDGSGNFTNWSADFSGDKLPYLQYLADEGFAVISIFAWGNKYYSDYPNCGNAYPYPVPINLASIEAGIEYACSVYNLDKNNIHVMSKSQGGQVALYYASHPPKFKLRSIGMFSPVLDYLSMRGESLYADTRKAIAEELSLTGDTEYFGSTSFNAYTADAKTFWLANLEKINGMNEAWTLLVGKTLAEKYTASISNGETYWADYTSQSIYQDYDLAKIAFIPVKIWGAADDNQTPYMKMVETVKQLNNGGTEAHLKTFPNSTGRHNCADLGTNVESSVTAANGTVYTNLPSGWYENVLWMRSKMPAR